MVEKESRADREQVKRGSHQPAEYRFPSSFFVNMKGLRIPTTREFDDFFCSQLVGADFADIRIGYIVKEQHVQARFLAILP